MTGLTIESVALFAKKFTIMDSGCWEWSANKSYDGYGRFNVRGKVKYAHRVAYMLVNGKIALDKELDHLCRVRHCVNPSHLEEVTHKENVRRGDGNPNFALYNSSKTHCPQGHEYNLKNTRIEKGRAGTSRKCRVCDATRHRAMRREKRNAS